MINLRISISVGDVAKKLQEFVDKTGGAATKALQSQLDRSAKKRWLQEGGVLHKSSSISGGSMLSSPDQAASRSALKQLGKVYAQAWADRYKEIQNAHQSHSNSSASWVRYKQTHQGDPTPWNDRPLGQDIPGEFSRSSYAIASGFMAKTISDSFKQDGQYSAFKMDNLLIQGAWEHDTSSSDYSFGGFNYVQKFTEYFGQELGILEDADTPVTFSRSQYNQVKEKMIDILKAGFRPAFIRNFEEIEIDIPLE